MRLYDVGYSWDASVQIFANDEAVRTRIGRIAGAAGAHILWSAVLDGVRNALLDYGPIAAIILHLTEADADQAGDLLDGLEANAQRGRCGAIVLFPPSMIDLVTAHLLQRDISLLCDAEEHDIRRAIEAVVNRRSSLLCDITAEAAGTLRLQQLSEEVERMGRALLALSAESRVRSKRASFRAGPASGPTAELNASFIRTLIRMRRLRDQYFRSELFADPAWDMLLDLLAARLEKRPVAVSSLCIAAAVPPTTALRWISTLTEGGLLIRVADPNDRRRIFIELSEDAADALIAYFQAMRQLGDAVV